MPLITLYRPDGEIVEFQHPTNFNIGSGFISFTNRLEDTPTSGKKVITSLPFIYEEEKDFQLGL